MKIRALTHADLDAVLALDQQTNPHPWALGHWHDSLAHHLAWVIEDASEVLGFAVASLVLDEAELLLIAIAPWQQGQGLGRRLLVYALHQLHAAGAQHLLLEVRATNRAARRLYDSLGGHVEGVRKGYYPLPHGGREDAMLYRLALPPVLINPPASQSGAADGKA